MSWDRSAYRRMRQLRYYCDAEATRLPRQNECPVKQFTASRIPSCGKCLQAWKVVMVFDPSGKVKNLVAALAPIMATHPLKVGPRCLPWDNALIPLNNGRGMWNNFWKDVKLFGPIKEQVVWIAPVCAAKAKRAARDARPLSYRWVSY